jgi:hypothetical protein
LSNLRYLLKQFTTLQVIAAILQAHGRNPENKEKVVLLLSVNPEQRQALQEELRLQHEKKSANPLENLGQPVTPASDQAANPQAPHAETSAAGASRPPSVASTSSAAPPLAPVGSLALTLPSQTAAPLLREVDTLFTSHERLSLYRGGGCLFVTSRILIVDLLNERVPLNQVSGIIVCNAHRVTETCAEAFILRLFRAGNKKG